MVIVGYYYSAQIPAMSRAIVKDQSMKKTEQIQAMALIEYGKLAIVKQRLCSFTNNYKLKAVIV